MRWLFLALAAFLAPANAHAEQATVVTACGAASLTPGTTIMSLQDVNGVACSGPGGQVRVVTACGSLAPFGPLRAGDQAYSTVDTTGKGCGLGTSAPSSVWSAADAAANGMTLSNGGLTVTAVAAGWQSIRGSNSHTTGKYYIEFLSNVGPVGQQGWGLASSGFTVTSALGLVNYSFGSYGEGQGNVFSSGFTSNYSGLPADPGINDVVAIAIDLTAGKLWLAQNNVWFGSGNPGTGANPMATIAAPAFGLAYFPGISVNGPTGGVWTLQSTAASQKYAPPAGFSAWDAGAAPGCAEATAYLARAPGETAHAADLTTLICGLVTDGVWAKLDALYVLAQQNQVDALLNLVGTSYGLTQVGSLAKPGPRTGTVVFAPYQGFSGFAVVGSYLDTGFNPTSASSPKYTLNSASFGVWSYAATLAAAEMQIGVDTSNHIFDNFSGGFWARINSGAAETSVPQPGAKGLFVAEKPNSTTTHPYWDGIDQGALAFSSTAIPNATFTVGSTHSNYSTTQTLSAAHIGASLGAAGQLALYNRLRTYMTSVGVP